MQSLIYTSQSSAFSLKTNEFFQTMSDLKLRPPHLRTMWPFYVSAVVVTYGVFKARDAIWKSPDLQDDPRNPFTKTASGAAIKEQHH